MCPVPSQPSVEHLLLLRLLGLVIFSAGGFEGRDDGLAKDEPEVEVEAVEELDVAGTHDGK